LLVFLASCGGREATPPLTEAPYRPIAAFLGYDGGTDKRQHDRFEESVRSCMEAIGFRYVPLPYVAEPSGGAFGPPLGLFGSIDLAALSRYKHEFGYGVTAVLDELRQAEARMRAGMEDPNAIVFGGLPVDEQAAYQEAVEGGGDPGRPGCLASAEAEVDPDPVVWHRLEAAYAQLRDRVASDARSVELDRLWSACLKASGHDFDSEDEIRRSLKPKMDRIVGAQRLRDAGGRDVTVVGAQSLRTPSHVGRGDRDDFAGVDRRVLAELRTHEMAIARADLDCRARIQPERDRIEAGYEEEFLRVHRQDLEHVRHRWNPGPARG
jgi:hypothetical protein